MACEQLDGAGQWVRWHAVGSKAEESTGTVSARPQVAIGGGGKGEPLKGFGFQNTPFGGCRQEMQEGERLGDDFSGPGGKQWLGARQGQLCR